MVVSGRTGIVCKSILLVSLLVVVTTVTLIMHAIMSNRRSLLFRTPVRHSAALYRSKPQPSGGGVGSGGSGVYAGYSGGGRPERGLMALITNVTKTVIAMEIQAKSLNNELKSVREKTRELLMQQRDVAMWMELQKCSFYMCKDKNTQGRAKRPIRSSGKKSRRPQKRTNSSETL